MDKMGWFNEDKRVVKISKTLYSIIKILSVKIVEYNKDNNSWI